MTFYIGDDLYGIEVMQIQEVTRELPVEAIPLAPGFVKGLINLRGQIATALDLRELFSLPQPTNPPDQRASVVCRLDGNLVSLLVDSLGDVIHSETDRKEAIPETVPCGVRKYLKEICKEKEELLSIIDLERLSNELSLNSESAIAG
jgi:purine-binding chemotaxis protein CheW